MWVEAQKLHQSACACCHFCEPTSKTGKRAHDRAEVEAMPDGTGVAMIDGKMQDDATWKQAKVISDLADLVAGKDPDLAKAYSGD